MSSPLDPRDLGTSLPWQRLALSLLCFVQDCIRSLDLSFAAQHLAQMPVGLRRIRLVPGKLPPLELSHAPETRTIARRILKTAELSRGRGGGNPSDAPHALIAATKEKPVRPSCRTPKNSARRLG